jgi:hypothetical protein
LYKKDRYSQKNNFHNVEMTFYGYLILGLGLSYFSSGNPTAIRDGLLLLLVIFLVKFMSRKNYIKVIRSYVYIISLLLLISWVIILLYWIGVIDRLNWQINNIFISENNPFILRELRLDFEWSLLLNYAVLAFNPAVNYQRMSLIFLEPSNLAEITFPLIFLVILDKKIPYRKTLIGILIASFVSSYSGWGIVVLSSSLILGLIAVNFFRSTLKFFIFISLIFFIMISDYITPLIKFLLTLLPNDKLAEFENKMGAGFFNISDLLGNYFGLIDIDALNQVSSYGAEIVIYRYGFFGFFAYVVSVVSFVILSASAATNKASNFSVKLYSFIAIFGTTLIAFKNPSLLLVMPLLLYYYINDVQFNLPQLNK